MADMMMPDMDLSHLSAEEREIIQQVFQRQKQEEASENQIAEKADRELDDIEKQINERKQNATRLVGTQDDAICQICQKTKFADGIGHKCFYCQLRSCARCGGRTQSKGKAIWACALCQKKQSILAKTGKWFKQPNEGGGSPLEGPTPSTSSVNLAQLPPQQQPLPQQPQPLQQSMNGPANNMQQQQQQRQYDSGPPLQQPQTLQQQPPNQQMRPNGGHALTNGGSNMMHQQQQQHQQPMGHPANMQMNQPMGQQHPPPNHQQQQPSYQQPQQQAPPPQPQPAPTQPAQIATGALGLLKGITGGIKDTLTTGVNAVTGQQPLNKAAPPPQQQPTQQQQQQQMQPEYGQGMMQQQQQPGQPGQPSMYGAGPVGQGYPQQRMGPQRARGGMAHDGVRRQASSTLNRQSSVESAGQYQQPNGAAQRGVKKHRRDEQRPVFYTDNDDAPIDPVTGRKLSGARRSDLSIDQQYGGQGPSTASSGPYPPRAEFRRTRSIRADENNRRGSISARLQEVAPVPAATPTTVAGVRKKNRLARQLRSMSSSDEESGAAGGASHRSATSGTTAPHAIEPDPREMGRGDPRIPADGDRQRLPQECASEKEERSLSADHESGTLCRCDSENEGGERREKGRRNEISADLLRYIYGNDLGGGAPGGIVNRRPGRMERARSVEDRFPPSTSGMLSRRPLSGAGFFGAPSGLRAAAAAGGIAPGGVLAAKIRSHLSQPVTWQPSADGRRLIGHIVLHRADTMPSGDLGLKVVGGRRSDTGRLGAFITQVRPGSVADTIGKLRAGDEVLEWNGHQLENTVYDNVYEVIAASKNAQQVELIVSRNVAVPGSDDFLNVQQYGFMAPLQQQRLLPDPAAVLYAPPEPDYPLHSPSLSPQLLASQYLSSALPHSQSAFLPTTINLSPAHKSSMPIYYGSPATQRGQIFGRIEIALLYSVHDRQLTVKIIRALDLPPRPDGVQRNPYCKLFLLPDRSEKSQRRSGVLAETTMPFWDESFFYHGLSEAMLMERVLEVTLWDYDKYDTNAFLGETLIDFTDIPLDGQPLLYTLVDMDDENPLRTRLRERRTLGVRRPHSEAGHYGRREPAYDAGMEPIVDYPYERSAARDRYGGGGGVGGGGQGYDMRRSRTCERGGYGWREQATLSPSPHHQRIVEDWTANNQNSGYLSDYGSALPTYGGGNGHSKHRARRPRSATAMRYLASEQARLYCRNLPPEPPPSHGLPEEPPDLARLGVSVMADPRSPNGRVIASEGGYGSDGSETLSAHSAHSNSVVRTINRRRTNEDIVREEAAMAEDAAAAAQHAHHRRRGEDEEASGGGGRGARGHRAAAAAATPKTSEAGGEQLAMKERKKSLMTRFIPGKGAAPGSKRTGFARSEEVGIPGMPSTHGSGASLGGSGGSGVSLEVRLQQTQQQNHPFRKQTSKESTDSGHSDNWPPVVADGHLGSFVDDLGPGQVVGRQVLASPVLGEIQLGIACSRAGIDVEVIRAKNLVVKPNMKICPAPYVKVYLMEGKTCVAKAKTNPTRKSTNALFQQHLIFQESPRDKMLQVTVLGDYGRMERKAFMGIAQIRLDDLQLGAEPLIGVYKLFHSSSLVGTGAGVAMRKDSETSLLASSQPQSLTAS